MAQYEQELNDFRDEFLKLDLPIERIESFEKYVMPSKSIPTALLTTMKFLYQEKLDTEAMRKIMVDLGYGKFWDNTTPLDVYRKDIETVISDRVSRLTNEKTTITMEHKNFRQIMETLRCNELELAGAFMLTELEGRNPIEIATRLFSIIDSGNTCCMGDHCGHS